MARADPEQDHHRLTGASLRPPSHHRRPCGRRGPRTSWLTATDTGVQSVNIGIHSAWRKASDHTLWRRIVDTATLHHGARRRRRKMSLHLLGDVQTRNKQSERIAVMEPNVRYCTLKLCPLLSKKDPCHGIMSPVVIRGTKYDITRPMPSASATEIKQSVRNSFKKTECLVKFV